tara:strand:- start:226 stop:1971 length:1746 start_codon:yes stop_codon:yes gene_type:complete
MAMNLQQRKNNQGMALLMALFFIGIAVLVVGVLMSRLMNQRKTVAHYEDYSNAFLGLEAAIARSKVEIENGEDGIIGMDGWQPVYRKDNKLLLPDFDSDDVTPQTLASMEEVEFAAYTVTWSGDGRDNNANGLVDDATEEDMYTVYAMGRKGAATRRAEVNFRGNNVNVWQNAVFAGPGEVGGLISGSVNARGSVHMLGDNLLGGVIGLATLGLGGTTTIRNNYLGIPNIFVGRVPPLPQTIVEGETVETLGATLRAKGGILGLSATSTLGDPQTIGNTVKETLDAVFVTDGWIGDAVIPDGNRGDPTNVYSDNGWDALYDLADKVVFPLLDGPWRNDQTGAELTNPDTGSPYKHEEYFTEVLVGDPSDPLDGIYTGDIAINTQSEHFYWNATTGEQMQGTLPGTSPPKTDDYILFDKNKDVLEISGQIVIDGNLKFQGKGTQKTIYYTGKGAILVTGDVQIDSHLLSVNDGDPTQGEGSFPVNNALGIMAGKKIVLGSGLLDLIFRSELNIMGAFYAGTSITSLKKTNVAGTLVSNYFDLTLNPPAVYEVPALGKNLPEGMIGDYPITAIAQLSWRELDT